MVLITYVDYCFPFHLRLKSSTTPSSLRWQHHPPCLLPNLNPLSHLYYPHPSTAFPSPYYPFSLSLLPHFFPTSLSSRPNLISPPNLSPLIFLMYLAPSSAPYPISAPIPPISLSLSGPRLTLSPFLPQFPDPSYLIPSLASYRVSSFFLLQLLPQTSGNLLSDYCPITTGPGQSPCDSSTHDNKPHRNLHHGQLTP